MGLGGFGIPFQNRLVFANCFLNLAAFLHGERQRQTRFLKIGLEFDGSLQLFRRHLQILRFGGDKAKIVVCLHVVGVEADRFIESCLSLALVSQSGQRYTQSTESLAVLGVIVNGLSEFSHCLLPPLLSQ